MRFWMGLMIMTLICLGLSTQAVASPEVCTNLSRLAKGQATAKEVTKCHNKTKGAWYDFMALMICRDLNKLSRNGAKASEITSCLTDISKKRFKYSRLKKCKKKHKNTRVLRRCVRRSSV